MPVSGGYLHHQSRRILERVLQNEAHQNLTLKAVLHAGQSILRSPGFRFIRNWRSQPGQVISTLGMCGVTVK